MIELYRIVDRNHTSQILANAIPDYAQAQEILHFLQLDHPQSDLEIESYKQSSVRAGFGRDPDLH